jgi:hypothetical protein
VKGYRPRLSATLVPPAYRQHWVYPAWHFGGVPQRLVLDNLRAAVTKADWSDPEINPYGARATRSIPRSRNSHARK